MVVAYCFDVADDDGGDAQMMIHFVDVLAVVEQDPREGLEYVVVDDGVQRRRRKRWTLKTQVILRILKQRIVAAVAALRILGVNDEGDEAQRQ
jgi:hypothetical protein